MAFAIKVNGNAHSVDVDGDTLCVPKTISEFIER